MEDKLSDIYKANVLIEALPYIQKFSGNTVVIKYGGHAMVDPEVKKKVMLDILLLHSVGIRPVIVHGGGPEINIMLKRMGKESTFVQGLRVTDKETMEIAAMVLVGKLNTEIVSMLNNLGGKAVGLTGQDAKLFEASKKPMQMEKKNGEMENIDLGYVGQIEKVTPEIVSNLLDKGYIPVISPIAGGGNGENYNVNADTVAGMIAGALKADKLILLTDIKGVMRDINDPKSLISEIGSSDVPKYMEEGVLKGGMIPKAECAVNALQSGVGLVHILDGREPHAILLEMFTDGGIGTLFRK
ncbi:MAG: acetylglutamate kinase [Eubacteriales bacterium]